METRKFMPYNLNLELNSKDQDDISSAVEKFSNDNFQISLVTIDNKGFELLINGTIIRNTTKTISTYLSKECSLDHLYSVLPSGRRRLFKTIKGRNLE